MSDIRFNRWLHQSGTGGVSQDSSGNIGIGTTVPTMALDVRGNANVSDTFNATTGAFSGNISAVDGTFTGNVTIGGTLTYEDVANIDAVGIITAQSDVLIGRNLNVTGISTFQNNVHLLDDDELLIGGSAGTHDGLKIYHSTSGTEASYIQDTGSGVLYIDAYSSINLRRYSNQDSLASFNAGGAVNLYYDNSKKFETTNTGAVVTGILTATSSITGSNYEIAGISSSISDTAVDVFVYDTRKDSDGGAWRKRTQHTSWYNETLNTATRGSRREFPAVAVIVAEVEKLTIYDGDDPDLPMWMVFLSPSTTPYSLIPNVSGDITSITALNGKISLGYHHNYGLGVWDFISEFCINAWRENSRLQYAGTIAERNDQKGTISLGAPYILTYVVNDVAMTVLPNAPIDSATGLPIPTIAVATNGGVSVIKDDGTVVDITETGNSSFNYMNYVDFNKDGKLLFNYSYLSTTDFFKDVHVVDIPSADVSGSFLASPITSLNGIIFQRYYSGAPYYPHLLANNTSSSSSNDLIFSEFNVEAGDYNGLTRTSIDYNSQLNSMVAYATTSYNTGWMHGDIKGAFLSDTDATNVSGGGDGLITGSDSTFDDVIANLNWSERSGSGGAWNVSGGVLKTGTVASGEYLDITTSGYTSGQTYVISYTLANVTGSNPLRWRFNDGQMGDLPTSNGSHSYYVTLTETGTLFSLLNDANLTADIDNFKLQLVQEEDRSVNNKGLTAYGTITKSAVATGAELVAYSGFSGSNYLKYDASNMAFGTGDFSVSVWCIPPTNTTDNDFILELDNASTVNRFYLLVTTATPKRIYVPWDTDVTGSDLTAGQWNHVVVGRRSGFGFVYVNGKEISDGNDSFATNLEGNGFGTVGNYSNGPTNDYAWDGSLALLRISGSAPSAEQIKKIYEDEKVLFQENAACTLYGSSDAVTALAYDDSTNLLYAGTSSGRSDFQGLRRINNTTTAVTTAMSASNGLVAEQ